MGAGSCWKNGILCTETGIHRQKTPIKNGSGIKIYMNKTATGTVGFSQTLSRQVSRDPHFRTLHEVQLNRTNPLLPADS